VYGEENLNFGADHLIPKPFDPRLITRIAPAVAQAAMDSGASGYIIKDDQASVQNLAGVIRTVAKGGIHLSAHAYAMLMKRPTEELSGRLSVRQVEAISLCAAYPDASTSELAKKMNIESSTVRNLLSGAYLKLNVSTRAAAIAKARQLGLIPDNS